MTNNLLDIEISELLAKKDVLDNFIQEDPLFHDIPLALRSTMYFQLQAMKMYLDALEMRRHILANPETLKT